MRTLLNPWFVAGCVIWVIVYSFRRLAHPVPWINGYVDDFFAVPVIANLSLWFMRGAVIRSNYYVLSAWKVTFIVIYVSLVFEVLLPAFSKTYTGDWVDALLYAIGGVFFYFVMNKPALSKKPKA
ncbi:hypothetical protein [Mucilaginibacter ginsenosidivorans]|uniref:Magnesium citrate secondary transporter n=1 Tax=Mucilaginibacter ginsenosidivorans TaxID=398053 RepID=A0A5B8UQZ0_9SPHI|nr:hypothetical protein [Mucilaginibacter ginsenosidivorans]QEC61500.1 hypothetical protein FRZ54_02510 [Mucilaginibacter ginsenosidivorans]